MHLGWGKWKAAGGICHNKRVLRKHAYIQVATSINIASLQQPALLLSIEHYTMNKYDCALTHLHFSR
jgi:hypothetical protein